MTESEGPPKAIPWMTPWRYFVLFVLLIEIAWLVAPPPGHLVELWYSQGFYRFVVALVSPIQNASPVPLAVILLTTLLITLACFGRRKWVALRRAAQSHWRIVPWFLGVSMQAAVLLLLWMLVLWGAGYQRDSISERWALDSENFTAEESLRLRAQLLALIQEHQEGAKTESPEAAIAAIANAMEGLVVGGGEKSIRLPRQVRATPPGLFLALSTGGMCVPAAVEPWVDGALDPVSFTQVAAHELGHVAGYNRESEATLMGYLAGLRAESPLARYAVALDIYMDLIRRFPDREAYEAAWDSLPETARADVERGREISQRYRINIALIQKARYHVYDTYLKSQGIEEGVVNYSAGFRLFSGAWRKGLAGAAVSGITMRTPGDST